MKIAEVARKYGLKLVMAFGSAVTGKLHERSDIDIAVLSSGAGLPFERFVDISVDLQALFPEQDVDLVALDRADPLLLKQIAENAMLLSGRPTDFNEFKIYAYKRYIDHKPYLKMERQFAREYPGRVKRAAG